MVKLEKYLQNNPINSNGSSQPFIFPAHSIDAKKKEEPWYALRCCEAIYSQYVSGMCMWSYDDRAKFNTNRMYADGQQPWQQYRDQLNPKTKKMINKVGEDGREYSAWSGEYERIGEWNIDFTNIFSIAPKQVDVIVSKFSEIDYECEVDAIDEDSGFEREQMKANIKYQQQFKLIISKLLSDANIPQKDDPSLPETDDEFEIWQENGGFKLNKETGMEKALSYTFYASDFRSEERLILKDLATINCSAVIDKTDEVTGEVRAEYADMYNVIVAYSRTYDKKKSPYWGYFELWTIVDLRMATGLPEEELWKMAQQYKGQFGNPGAATPTQWQYDGTRYSDKGFFTGGFSSYDNFKIPVMLAQWATWDTEYTSVEKKSDGNTVMFSSTSKKSGSNKEVSSSDTKCTYSARWIVGTKTVFDNKKDFNQNGELSLHIFKAEGKSIVERGIPMYNELQIAYLNLQNELANSLPAGMFIDWGSLMNISEGNSELTPYQNVALFRANGTGYFKSTDAIGKSTTNTGKPFYEFEGTNKIAWDNFALAYNTIIRVTQDISGLTPQSDASGVNPSMPVETSKMLLDATTNVLKPIWDGFIVIKESLGKSCMARLQSVIKYNEGMEDRYNAIIGRLSTKMFKISSDDMDAMFSLTLKAKPTDDEKQEIRQMCLEAIKAQQLTASDYFAVMRAADVSIKFAQQIMQIREDAQMKKQAAIAQQNAASQTQGQQALEAQKAQQQQQMAQIQLQMDLQKENALSQIRIKERYALIEAEFIEQWNINFALEFWKAKEADRTVETDTYHKFLDQALSDIGAKRDASLQAQQTAHEANMNMIQNQHQGQVDAAVANAAPQPTTQAA